MTHDIVSDRGPQFISRVWQDFFRLLGVSVSLSSGYHPQTNGQTEQKIQEIGRYLCSYCHQHQDFHGPFPPLCQACPKLPTARVQYLFSACSATSRLCSLGLVNLWRFQLPTICLKKARGFGTQHTYISSRQCQNTRAKLKHEVLPLPSATQGN